MTYLYHNWKLVLFDPLHPYHPPLVPSPHHWQPPDQVFLKLERVFICLKPNLFFPCRPDLLRSEGIPSVEVAPTASPLSGSPKLSSSSSKSRYRSKPRHRRGNSRGSHGDFAAILKNQPAQEDSPHPTSLHQAEPQYPSSQHHNLLQQQYQQPPPAMSQSHHPRLNMHGQDIATCANNLRYFGPAAALRSPLSNHSQRQMPGSSPDLISTAMAADCWRSSEPDKGQAGPWGCCQADPYDPCLQCRPEQHGSLDVPSAKPVGRSPSLFKPPAHNPLLENAQGSEKMEENEFSGYRSASSLGASHHITPPVLPRKTRPLQKVRCNDNSSASLPLRNVEAYHMLCIVEYI